MEQLINIDKTFYTQNKNKTTNWLCNIFGISKEEMNLDKQLSNGVYFTLLLKDNQPVSVCRFVVFDDRKTVFCSRQIQTHEKFRQQGYAEKVLNEGFKFLKEKYNCKKMISYISKDNFASLALHKKVGYIKQTKPIKYYKENRFAFEDCEIMERT